MKFEKIELKSNSAILVISLASALRGAGAEGSESRAELLASVLASLSIKMNAEGVTGGNLITENAANDCYYSVEGSVLTIHLSGLRLGSVTRVNLSAKYGTNTDSLMVIDLVVPEVADGEAEEHHLCMDAVSTIGGGGSADYKTDQYFDADGRLLVERAEDGSTIIYDEHENPIVKRKADGTTEVYDAYQSVRQGITPHGNVWINPPADGQLSANGSMAQGASGNVASGANSHAEGYGCTASGAASHAEGTATIASGQGSHAEGSSSQTSTCEASGENAHAEGLGCVAAGKNCHAEGFENVIRDSEASHVEGYRNELRYLSIGSHVEGAFNYILDRLQFGGHVQGIYAKTVSNYTQPAGVFIHGCGTEAKKMNSVVFRGSEVYIFGVGGFQGTEQDSEFDSVLSLRAKIAELEQRISSLEG